MLAYHNDPAIKQMFVDRIAAHAAADEIVKGQYWENGKGCAIGCTYHSSDHMAAERQAGIPLMLARLEDRIFEGLPNSEAKAWPLRFAEAVQVGADLSMVGPRFLLWLLRDSGIPERDHSIVAPAFRECVAVVEHWCATGRPDGDAAWAAAGAARAAEAARAAAGAAAWAAAEAARAARAAAWAAAEAAGAAAEAAGAAAGAAGAAEAAAWAAADAAGAAAGAAGAAEAAAYSRQAEALLRLIAEAPLKTAIA